MDTSKSRYDHIDILRMIGCLMVIYIHTDERGYYRYAYSYPGATWAWDFFLSNLVQTGVPLFLAISGAMLLGKEESILQTYKRMPRILFDLCFFSIIYICLETRAYGQPIVPSEILIRIISRSYHHIWYLYAYIAFIITLPFLRPMVKGLNKQTANYLLFISFLVTGIIPVLGMFGIQICDWLNPTWITVNIFIYPVEGYIIDKLIDISEVGRKDTIKLTALTFICFAIDLLCAGSFFRNNPQTLNESFLITFNTVKVAFFFILIKRTCYHHVISSKIHSLISEIGKCTFGIYLIHIFVLDRKPTKYFWYAIENSSWGHHIGVYISCIGTFLIAFVIIYICRKIPFIKKMF